jgi:hypothetical protein
MTTKIITKIPKADNDKWATPPKIKMFANRKEMEPKQPKPKTTCAVCQGQYLATSRPTHIKSRRHIIAEQSALHIKLKSLPKV